MARAWLFDVFGYESGHFGPGRAMRVDIEPKFRRTTGPWRSHALDESRFGGEGGCDRPYWGMRSSALSELGRLSIILSVSALLLGLYLLSFWGTSSGTLSQIQNADFVERTGRIVDFERRRLRGGGRTRIRPKALYVTVMYDDGERDRLKYFYGSAALSIDDLEASIRRYRRDDLIFRFVSSQSRPVEIVSEQGAIVLPRSHSIDRLNKNRWQMPLLGAFLIFVSLGSLFYRLRRHRA